jgi:hypothetical protein
MSSAVILTRERQEPSAIELNEFLSFERVGLIGR